MAAQKRKKKFPKKKTSTFWWPGDQPETWDSDLNFSLHALLHNELNCFGHLVETSSKCHKPWGQNF